MENQTKSFKIIIVGIGDYGIRFIEALGKLPNVEGININTDWVIMGTSDNKKLKIGKKVTNGLGAGALAKLGMKAAEEDKEIISNSLKDGKVVLIVAGLGGGTGSGASPVVCDVAKELHIPTIAFVTTPPDFEGKIRRKNADDCIEQLKKVVDSLVIISADRLLENFTEMQIIEFYDKVDEMLRLTITNVIKYIYSQEIEEKSMKDILKTLKNDNLCNIIYEGNYLNPIIEYFSNN